MQSRAWAITWRKCVLLAAFVTTTGVCSLTAQTPQELELTRAARHFRRQVYLNYRTDRPEFDRRRAAAAQAENAYRDGGANPEDAERLRSWLLAGAAASHYGDALPPAPSFHGESRVAREAPANAPPQQPRVQGPLPPPEIPHTEPAPRAAETPAETAPPSEPAKMPPQSKIVESPSTPNVHEEENPPTETRVTEAPSNTEAPSRPPLEEALTPATETPATDVQSTETETPATPTQPDNGEALPFEEADPFENATPPDEEQPTTETQPDEHAPTEVPTSPDATGNGGFDPNAHSASGVNLTELTSRVAGHNFAVSAILLDWRRGEQGDVDDLTTAVEKTEALSGRYGMLNTYVGLLTENERAQAEDLASLDEVFTVLGDAIAEMREKYETSNLSEQERAAAVERLNALSRRLAKAYEVYEADSE